MTGNPEPNACGTRTTSRASVYTDVDPYTNLARTSNTTLVRVGRLGSAANTAAVSNEPTSVDSDAVPVTVAAVSCHDGVPLTRHCTAPVNEAAPPCGAPAADTATVPCVVTVVPGATKVGAPYPKLYDAVDDCFPVGDFTNASSR